MGKWPLVALVAVISIAADQITKIAVWHWLKPLGQVKVIPGFFDLTITFNSGVVFGLLGGMNNNIRVPVLVGLGLLALMVIFFFIAGAKDYERLLLWGLALVTGGAVGNIVDRVRLGAVIDFLDFYFGSYHWHTFNLADIGITVGTGLVMIHMWKYGRG